MFQKGDRVRMSVAGIKHLGYRDSVKTGIVSGQARKPNLVSVRLDGQKTSSTYSVNFWEVEPRPDAPVHADIRFSARREGLIPMKGK